MTKSPNQYSGRNSPGFRFCFHVRAIAHRSLFLPIAMRNLPEIQRLLSGESPLSVFGCGSYPEARRRFSELRKRHDFPYWAITEYFIPDINDADQIIPLRLNERQHYMIDTMLRLYSYRRPLHYVITKSSPRCGLTTCVQAYIIWMQRFQLPNNSYTCSSSEINLFPLKTNLFRLLRRRTASSDKRIHLPEIDWSAFFNTYRSPDMIRGINLGFVHFADMSKWKDHDGSLASRAVGAAVGAVLRAYFTLVVYEGNIPDDGRFPYMRMDYTGLPFSERMARLSRLSGNPYFLNHVLNAATSSTGTFGTVHINLEHIHQPSSRLHVPYRPSRIPFA